MGKKYPGEKCIEVGKIFVKIFSRGNARNGKILSERGINIDSDILEIF